VPRARNDRRGSARQRDDPWQRCACPLGDRDERTGPARSTKPVSYGSTRRHGSVSPSRTQRGLPRRVSSMQPAPGSAPVP
jgi:hypothetical protein